MGLDFDGFNVINVGNAATGVKPQSGDQVGVQYILTTGVDNTATLKTAGNTKYFVRIVPSSTLRGFSEGGECITDIDRPSRPSKNSTSAACSRPRRRSPACRPRAR